MSADTSDPALQSAVTAVHAQDDPTSWLVAGYAAPGTPKLVLIEAGPDPALPPLRRLLDSDAVARADATFAYASVQGKGFVILRLGNTINVVKRARAIVHSRTFAALFPDYLALSTINKTGQFTEELIAEQLGLDPSSVSVASPAGNPASELPDVTAKDDTAPKSEEPATTPAAAKEVPTLDHPVKPVERAPEPTQQPTPAATPPPTGPPPAPPKSAARARSIKRKPSKPAPPSDPSPSDPTVPPSMPEQRTEPAGAASLSTPTPPTPTPAAPAANPLPTPPIAAASVVPTPQEPVTQEPPPPSPAEKSHPPVLPQISTAARTSLAESSSTASVVNPATPPAAATQQEGDSMSDHGAAFGRDGLGRDSLPAPPLLTVSTKELSDGTGPVTPVTTHSALTDTTFDSPSGSSMQNSPYPTSEHGSNHWSNARRYSRGPSRPLSPDASSSREPRPTSMPVSPKPPRRELEPSEEHRTVVISASPEPTRTETEETDQERTSQKTPTPQPHTTEAPGVPLSAGPSETAAASAPVAAARPLPAAEVQRPHPPPPPRRLPSMSDMLPGALPSRTSSRNGSMQSPPIVSSSSSRADSPRLNGSPRSSDGPGKPNGPGKQSPFSRLNTSSSNSSSPQPGSSPKQSSTPTSPPVADAPRALHRSASMSSAGSGSDSRSAVSPVSVFPPTMPTPPPVPSHDGAEYLTEPEMHLSQDTKSGSGNGVGGVAGMAGIGAAYAAKQALAAAHDQDKTPVADRSQSQLAHVPVRRSSRRALNAAAVTISDQPPTLDTTIERPSLESRPRSSTEGSRSSLGRSNSLDSGRNRPTVTAAWRARSPSISSLASAAGSERKRPLGSRPMRSPSLGSENTPPMVTARRVTSPEPISSAESTTPKPEDSQTIGSTASDASTKSESAEPVESLSHPVVRQLSLSQSQSTSTSGVATPDSGRSIGHRKTPSGNRKPAPPIDQALIEALKKESVSSDLERLQRSTPSTPIAAPAVSPFIPIEKKEPPPPIRIVPKKVPPPLPLTATMLNVVPPSNKPAVDSDVPKGLPSPGLLSPKMPISPRTPHSPASPRHSVHSMRSMQSMQSRGSDYMGRMNAPVGSSRDSHQSRLSQRMSNRLSQFSARMSRRISSDSGGHHRPYMEDSSGYMDYEHGQASVANAALARQSTARSVSLSNGRLTPIKTSAPSSSQASESSLPLASPVVINGDYRSARDITGPVEGMVIITADAPSASATEKETSSASKEDTVEEKADEMDEKPEKIDKGDRSEKPKENGIKRKAPPPADVVDLSVSPQIAQSSTLSPPINAEHFSAVSPQFVNAPRQPISAGVSPSIDGSPAMYQQRYPETPQTAGASPAITTSPPSSLDRHSSLSQKLRHALRSNSIGESGHVRPDFLPVASPVASPPSPTVSNFSISNSPNPNRSSIHGSLGRAFRLRAGSNNPKPAMKGTSPGGISSEDFKHLHEQDALHGLGLGMAFPPNSYRTPSGGLGYTPPAKKGRSVSNISAEEALANVRLKNMAEQDEAQERWRRLESERMQNRNSGLTSPAYHGSSRGHSMASSGGLSEDDNAPTAERISESSEQTRSFVEPDVGRPILPRSSLAEPRSPKHKRLSSRDLGTRESMQTLSSLDDDAHRSEPPEPRSPEVGVPRSYTRDSIVSTVLSSESEVRFSSSSEVRESKVSLEPDVRSIISPRTSYETTMSPEPAPRPSVSRNTSFGQARGAMSERGSLYRASTFEPRLSRDTMRSTGSRASFEQRRGPRSVSRSSFDPPSRMSRDNSYLTSPIYHGLEPLDVPDEQPLDEETESEREARLEAEAAEAARLEQERAERAAQKKAEAERREAERLAAAEKAEAERQRLEAEKARRRAEEAARRDKQQAAVREQLASGKADGGVMLRGWVTVQGMSGLSWRRRYFHLTPQEMQMFKGEGEGAPVNTIALGARTTIDHDVYEESQVRGAWKLRGERGEEFFMFADSEQERDVVMEGFRIAIGREV